MEGLMKVLAAKKREISVVQNEKMNKRGKYLRRSEVESILLEKSYKETGQRQDALDENPTELAVKKNSPKKSGKDGYRENVEMKLSLNEVKKRLRVLAQPVTLFGESKRDRIQRLTQLENDAAQIEEEGLGQGHDIRNTFMGEDEKKEKGEGEEEDYDDMDRKDQKDEEDPEDLSECMTVYRFFKKMLHMWEKDLSNRPDHIKRTAQGKMATKTMKQCKDYIRPLFKLCKQEEVPSDILPNLVDIVRFCEEREFVRANDAYIKLAIGNAAWPIGVTMVGIHERTGREKINANKQAHVMNNESQRKYLTSVKRLISYYQSISNVLPSKKVA
jgi:pre-mRNA-splicing factor 18